MEFGLISAHCPVEVTGDAYRPRAARTARPKGAFFPAPSRAVARCRHAAGHIDVFFIRRKGARNVAFPNINQCDPMPSDKIAGFRDNSNLFAMADVIDVITAGC